MKTLKERILAEGQNLGNGILKIDSLLNHQISPDLMMDMGREMASRFADVQIDIENKMKKIKLLSIMKHTGLKSTFR